jgi:hypothetical protein
MYLKNSVKDLYFCIIQLYQLILCFMFNQNYCSETSVKYERHTLSELILDKLIFKWFELSFF